MKVSSNIAYRGCYFLSSQRRTGPRLNLSSSMFDSNPSSPCSLQHVAICWDGI